MISGSTSTVALPRWRDATRAPRRLEARAPDIGRVLRGEPSAAGVGEPSGRRRRQDHHQFLEIGLTLGQAGNLTVGVAAC
jgi:hypothetical protein